MSQQTVTVVLGWDLGRNYVITHYITEIFIAMLELSL